MSLKGFTQQRREVFQTIINFMEEERSMEREKLEAHIQFEFGLSSEKAKEYLDVCLEAGKLESKEGEICHVEDND